MSAVPGKRVEVWSLVLLCGVQLMLILDFSIVNVALPAIGGQFGLSRSGLQWVAGSYGLTLGGLLLLGGRLSDLLGRRRLFVAGLAVFAAASLAGG
ncbi:MAG: MFS transporter, partial [Trebonia sp.]